MEIDIDKLTETELKDLNHRVVARLQLIYQMRAHAAMLEFHIGEKIAFQPEGHPEYRGIITKYNRKSVTVITEHGQHWTVHPVHLRKLNVVDAASSPTQPTVLISAQDKR